MLLRLNGLFKTSISKPSKCSTLISLLAIILFLILNNLLFLRLKNILDQIKEINKSIEKILDKLTA